MYQVEIKYQIISKLFNPKNGWTVHTDLDAMELGKGTQNNAEKRIVGEKYSSLLKSIGVLLKAHPEFGRADIVAQRNDKTFIIEVEGLSNRQPDQALYSLLGQLLLKMKTNTEFYEYGIAVPYNSVLENQLSKIPLFVKNHLRLKYYIVGKDDIKIF